MYPLKVKKSSKRNARTLLDISPVTQPAGKSPSRIKEIVYACAFCASLPTFLLSACSADSSTTPQTPPGTQMPQMPQTPQMPQMPQMPQVSEWVREARIAGVDADPSMDMAAVKQILLERKSQNVSVLEVDSGLSNIMTDDQFAAQVTFLDNVAKQAHALGMHAVIYYPSLEVLTPNGESLPHSMYKDHPDWVQRGLGGEPNVFYGGKEHWVEPGAESVKLRIHLMNIHAEDLPLYRHQLFVLFHTSRSQMFSASRGYGDLDGDQDFVIMRNNDKVQLYRNDLTGTNIHWLRVKLNTNADPGLAQPVEADRTQDQEAKDELDVVGIDREQHEPLERSLGVRGVC